MHDTAKKAKKRRIDIDDEDSIPDIRMSRTSFRRSATRKDRPGTQKERPNDLQVKKQHRVLTSESQNLMYVVKQDDNISHEQSKP